MNWTHHEVGLGEPILNLIHWNALRWSSQPKAGMATRQFIPLNNPTQIDCWVQPGLSGRAFYFLLAPALRIMNCWSLSHSECVLNLSLSSPRIQNVISILQVADMYEVWSCTKTPPIFLGFEILLHKNQRTWKDLFNQGVAAPKWPKWKFSQQRAALAHTQPVMAA